MAYAKIRDDGRVELFVFQDSIDDDGYVEFDNPEFVLETTSYSTDDFRIENGTAVFDPQPESVEALRRSNATERVPEYMDDTDDALCELYESSLEQSAIIDDQDAAICALYEMIGG